MSEEATPPDAEAALPENGSAPDVAQDESPSTETALPDRLSLDPRSEYFDGEVLQHGVRINFNGVEKTNVEEYCISEGWIRVAAGRSRDRNGNPMTLKLKGVVEPFVGHPDAA